MLAEIYELEGGMRKAIDEYVYYYNNERIKARLKGLTPIEYRNQAFINY